MLQVTPDNPNVAQLVEAESVLASILPGNWLHKDNILSPKHSNTSTARTAEPEPVEHRQDRTARTLDTVVRKQDKDMGIYKGKSGHKR